MPAVLRQFLMFIVTALLLSVTTTVASAGETATIVNESDRNTDFYVKWAGTPYWSDKFVLAPGESTTFRSFSGDRLDIRYNSTPGVAPARVRGHRVFTADVPPGHPGFASFFRSVSQYVVELSDR